MLKVSHPESVPLNSKVDPVVIMLLQKEVGEESGHKKLIEL